MVETLQHPFELEQLVRLYQQLQPRRVLEIGAWEGGRLRHWITAGHSEYVVVVDDEMRRADEWHNWSDAAGVQLRLIKGRSQDAAVIEHAKSYAPYDFVFVDADHRYEAGVADWENYRGMVAPGGLMVFHDIRRYQHGDLDRLWDDIRVTHPTVEIHDRRGEAWGGLGAVWL